MEKGYEVIFYADASGQCLTKEFLDDLPDKAKGKVLKWIQKLEQEGPYLPRPYADIVRGKIRELRVIFASGHYRFLYFFYYKYIVITHGFIKKTDKIPENEIERAHRYMRDFEKRVAEGEIEL
jgi:phage-related protein